MAATKLSALPGVGTLTGAELIYVVQAGVSSKLDLGHAVIAGSGISQSGVTLAVIAGTSNQIYHGDLSWSAVVLTSQVSGVLPIANGGTNSSTALSNGRVVVSSGDKLVEAAAPSDTLTLMGTDTTGTSVGNVKLKAGSNITITRSSDSITFAAAGGSGGGDVSTTTSNTFTVGPQVVVPATDGQKGVVVQRHSAGQTANLFEADNESGGSLFYVTPSGGITGIFASSEGYLATITNGSLRAFMSYYADASGFYSTSDGTFDLGNTTLRWRDLYLSGWTRGSAGTGRNTANVNNATTSFVNLSDLSRTLVSGRKYFGRLSMKCNNTAATEGIKFDFNGGTATMTNFWAAGGVLASGGTDVIGTTTSTSLAGVINFTTLTGETGIVIEFSMVCNAGGTFIPRFAENSTAVGTATVELGSFISMLDSSN